MNYGLFKRLFWWTFGLFPVFTKYKPSENKHPMYVVVHFYELSKVDSFIWYNLNWECQIISQNWLHYKISSLTKLCKYAYHLNFISVRGKKRKKIIFAFFISKAWQVLIQLPNIYFFTVNCLMSFVYFT